MSSMTLPTFVSSTPLMIEVDRCRPTKLFLYTFYFLYFQQNITGLFLSNVDKAICKISGHRHSKSETYNIGTCEVVPLPAALARLGEMAGQQDVQGLQILQHRRLPHGGAQLVRPHQGGLFARRSLAGDTGTRFPRRRCIKCIQRRTKKNPDLWRDQPAITPTPATSKIMGGGGREMRKSEEKVEEEEEEGKTLKTPPPSPDDGGNDACHTGGGGGGRRGGGGSTRRLRRS